MPILYKRLRQELNLSKPYICKQVLPEWWDPELDTDPVATLEGASYISSRLGLSLDSLLDLEHPIAFTPVGMTKFKRRQDTADLTIAQSMATHIADLVTYTCKQPYTRPPTSPRQVRQAILASHPTANLEAVLAFCWHYGIPVLHFDPSLPPRIRKMDGMVAYLNDHPVIVLCSNKKLAAWQLFNLAHELGHILCGHVTEGILVDEDITQAEQDQEEQEANQWAVELLGTEHLKWPEKLDTQALKDRACLAQVHHSIDPSASALNYAWQQQDWLTGLSVAKQFEPSANAPHLINQLLSGQVEINRLSDENQAYLWQALKLAFEG